MQNLLAVIALLWVVTGTGPLGAQTGYDLFQKALAAERADGNLRAAIQMYERIVKEFGSDRTLTARALMRIAECHERLGEVEAQAVYERLVRDFADQAEEAATARARLRRTEPPSGRGVTTRLAWTLPPNGDLFGSVSPDGRYVSYVDWTTGDLILRDLTGRRNRPLTNKGTWNQSQEYALTSAISRDGRQIAYSWYTPDSRRFELRVAPLGTTRIPTARVLFASSDAYLVWPMDWSPDGSWIAVHVTRTDRTQQLALVGVRDGSLRVLKSTGFADPFEVFFSPDGRYLGFDAPAGDGGAGRDVFVISSDGAREVHAVADPALDTMVGWSRDGLLLFASDRTGGVALWGVPTRDGQPTGSSRLLKADSARQILGITRTNTLYTGVEGGDLNVEIAEVDFATGRMLTSPTPSAHTFIGFNVQPDWSPDGTQLSYVSARNRNGGARALAIRSIESGRTRELQPALRFFQRPRWASDGRSLITQGSDLQGRQGIFRIDPQTGDAIALALADPGGQLFGPQMGPDASKIYYRKATAGVGEALIERNLVSGTDVELLRHTGEGLGSASISPDGRTIATTRVDRQDRAHALVVMPAAGGPARELLRVRDPQTLTPRPAWTADGRGVLVSKSVDPVGNASELWLVPLDGGPARRIDLPGIDFDVHPDGRRVAFVSGAAHREIWTVDGFLTAR